jgi:Protein of unknown function (DUF2971)
MIDLRGLAHYTSGEGLLGIVGSMSIRASHIFFLNDSTEYRLTSDHLKGMVPRINSLRTLAAGAPDLTRALESLNPRQRGRHPSVFVVSFSEHWDDLSQWRGYTSPGDGYSIVFDFPSLQRAAIAEGWRLEPCVYSDELDVLLPPIVEQMYVGFSTGRFGSVDEAMEWLLAQMLPLTPRVKHSGFSHEREWRLISPMLDELSETFLFRSGQSYLVPYVNFRLEDPARHPVIHINVGPGPNSALAGEAVGLFIVQHGVNCGYGISGVPYRPW